MSNFLYSLVNGIVGEILFYIIATIIILPFSIVDFFIVRKISRLKLEEDEKYLKRYNKIKVISAAAAAIVVGIALGYIMQYALKIDVLENDLSSLAVFVVALSVLPLTMCIFDLVRYFKLKKACPAENKKREESEDADIWL